MAAQGDDKPQAASASMPSHTPGDCPDPSPAVEASNTGTLKVADKSMYSEPAEPVGHLPSDVESDTQGPQPAIQRVAPTQRTTPEPVESAPASGKENQKQIPSQDESPQESKEADATQTTTQLPGLFHKDGATHKDGLTYAIPQKPTKVGWKESEESKDKENGSVTPKTKVKVLKRKNTPASLPKVDKLCAKDKVGGIDALSEEAEEEEEEEEEIEDDTACQGAVGGVM